MKSLCYRKVMIMVDQQQDESHIKRLLLNFIHHNWPELLHQNFLEEFVSPIVKAIKKRQILTFYSIPANHNTYTIITKVCAPPTLKRCGSNFQIYLDIVLNIYTWIPELSQMRVW
ncbi:hypothetical protein FQA39_LY13406 [Lamprigera yunnana]|nr:hypothetical protein FQA39_LY13406 [Lamprigera yunnana]